VAASSVAIGQTSPAPEKKEEVKQPSGEKKEGAGDAKTGGGADAKSKDADPNVKRDITHYNLGKEKLAIEGYDPVAYFTEGGGKATKGKKELAYTYRGATYHFATKENRDRFKKEPGKYEPAYGGWCASAIAYGGKKVEIDPKNFKVTGGRLFVFYKDLLQDAKDFWNKDEPKHTEEADGQWKKIAGEEARKEDAEKVKKDEGKK
jgi:YHS domain-containing protein